MNKLISTGFLVVILAAVGSYAFDCYHCEGSQCGEVKDEMKKACVVIPRDIPGGNVWYCYTHGEGNTRSKGCTKDTVSLFCVDKDDCDVCDEDECNAATGQLASVGLLAIAALLVTAY